MSRSTNNTHLDAFIAPVNTTVIANTTYDVCIIGAGVVGAALAAYLGKSKITVLVIDKDFSEQDRIVGELLQPDGVQKLKEMQLEAALENIDAVSIKGYALFLKDKSHAVAYPKNTIGKGLRNGKFIQQLRKQAYKQNSVTFLQADAKQLISENEIIKGVTVQDAHTKESIDIKADLTIASDGMFSLFRKKMHTSKPDTSSYFVGLVLKNITVPYAQHGHVFMNKDAPTLCYPITSDSYRLLIDFPDNHIPKKGKALQHYLLNEIKPILPKQFHQAFDMAIYEGNIKSMCNQHLDGKIKYTKGSAIIGDALNMRHPLTGGGMTVGLTDAKTIGDIIIKYNKQLVLQNKIEAFYKSGRIENASINILANALYGVVKNEDLAAACYDYLAKGGLCESVPVSLLSGINRNKKDLIYHFFKVALHGAIKKIKKNPTLQGIASAYKIVQDAFKMVHPLMKIEKQFWWEKILFAFGNIIF